MEESGNVFGSAIAHIAERAETNIPKHDSDYIGEDGFLYCGLCHTRKQCEVKWFDGRMNKVPVLCACESAKDQQEKALKEQVRRFEMIESLKKDSLMDVKFRQCSFDTAIETESNKRQLKICRRYAEKFGELSKKNQGLLLYGDVGTGKTYMACCIGNYLMERLVPVFATSIIKVLQSKPMGNRDDTDTLIKRMNAADLLILDDLGAERSTEYAVETVYNVIDSRYRVGKPVIVTTNLTLEEMQDSTDIKCRRIYDRIFEVCYPLRFEGKSLRRKEAAGRFNEMKALLEG